MRAMSPARSGWLCIDDGKCDPRKYVGLEIRAYRTRCHGSPPFGTAAAFRLQAAASKVTGLQACGVELHTGVSAFQPVSQRDQVHYGASAVSRTLPEQFSLPARRISTLLSGRPVKIPAMDGGRDAPGVAARLAAGERRRDRRSPSCRWTALQVPARRQSAASRSCLEECGLRS
jgi:hypothetical protein